MLFHSTAFTEIILNQKSKAPCGRKCKTISSTQCSPSDHFPTFYQTACWLHNKLIRCFCPI